MTGSLCPRVVQMPSVDLPAKAVQLVATEPVGFSTTGPHRVHEITTLASMNDEVEVRCKGSTTAASDISNRSAHQRWRADRLQEREHFRRQFVLVTRTSIQAEQTLQPLHEN